jgi:hypothetical protein
MPDPGKEGTDGEVLPELYHQAPSTTLAHNIDPSMIRIARGVFSTGSCFGITVTFSDQVKR